MNTVISVLSPAYNVEAYLAEAIESVLAQTLPDFELLILDDGSNDGSADVARSYATRDARVRVWARPNRGISATRNELLAAAKGDVVAWMDADDIAEPQWLEKLSQVLTNHSACLVAGCLARMVDADGLPIRVWRHPLRHEEIDAAHIARGTKTIMFGSSLMRRSALRQVGGFREDLVGAEDLDVLLKLAEVGRIECIPDVLYRYRQHLGSTCRARSSDVQSDVGRVVEAACRRRGVPYHGPDLPPTSPSHADAHRKWAWWALRDGYGRTARKHAWLACRREPCSRESWRVLYCALRNGLGEDR